jgi:hypothetical protein
MPGQKYEIVETLVEFPKSGKYHKELNLVKWGDREPKYDLRGWSDDQTEMTKGITLTKEEMAILKEKIGGINL